MKIMQNRFGLARITSQVLVALLLIVPTLVQAQAKKGDHVTMPAVTLLDGRELPVGHFDGKPFLVEYWASWCPYCARQNPHIQKLSDAVRGKGMEVLTISIDKKPQDATDYLAKNRYTFDAAMQTDALRSVFGQPKVLPLVFVVQHDGTIAEVITGEMFEEDVLELAAYALPMVQ